MPVVVTARVKEISAVAVVVHGGKMPFWLGLDPGETVDTLQYKNYSRKN